MYIPPKWHRDKLGGKSPTTEETSYRDFKVNAVDVAIEKEMILREYNRKKGGEAPEMDIPVLQPGQAPPKQVNGRYDHTHPQHTQQHPHYNGFESTAREFNQHDNHLDNSFPEYQLPRQTYPVEDLGIPLADDGSDEEYARGYDHGHAHVIHPNQSRSRGYDHHGYGSQRGYDGAFDSHRGHVRDDHVRGYEGGHKYDDHVTYESHMTRHAPQSMHREPSPGVHTGHVAYSYDHVDRSRSPAPHVTHIDRSVSRSPMPERSMSRSPMPERSMFRSPIPERSMSRSPAPEHSHVPNYISRNPVPVADYRAHSPNPGYAGRQSVPHIGSAYGAQEDAYVSREHDYISRDHVSREHDYVTREPDYVSRSSARSPAPPAAMARSPGPADYISNSHVSHVNRSPVPHINTSFDLSSDDEYSPPIQARSPMHQPPSPHLALSSDDDMMTVGEIKSAMDRDIAALPTVGDIRGGRSSSSVYSPMSGTPPTSGTPTRANRTWANTSRFSLTDRHESPKTAERPSSRLSYSEHSSDYGSVRSSQSREQLNTSTRDLGSSTSSISTFGYDSVGSNISRGSFRYDTCAARPSSRISCYDDDFANVTVETICEEPERSRGARVSRDPARDRISRDFGASANSRPVLDDPHFSLPTGDPHKSHDLHENHASRDQVTVKSLPQHVTPCAPPQPSYMSRSVAQSRPRCIVCDDHVAMNERIVQTEGDNGSRDIYHLRCFKCCICDSSLEHMEHYIDPHSDMLFCHVDYHETFSPKCDQCSSCIEGDYVQAMGKTFHVDHFFCAQCGKPFQEGQQHHIISGHAYCSPCHDVKTAEKCWRCAHVFNVNDPIIEVLDRLWCETCYSCEECSVPLKEEFTLTNDGVVLCEKCQTKRVKTYAWQ